MSGRKPYGRRCTRRYARRPAYPGGGQDHGLENRKRAQEPTAFIAATISADRKPLLTLSLTDDLVKEGYNASQIVREAAKLIKGGGGGHPFFAQAGGKDTDGLSAASDKIAQLLHL